MKEAIFRIVFFSVLVGIALGYNLWLNDGCEVVGVMTWSGKHCLD